MGQKRTITYGDAIASLTSPGKKVLKRLKALGVRGTDLTEKKWGELEAEGKISRPTPEDLWRAIGLYKEILTDMQKACLREKLATITGQSSKAIKEFDALSGITAACLKAIS